MNLDLQWQLLTSLERKRKLYSADPYFREAAWDAAGVLGDRLYPMLQSTALLVIKPEALAARRLRKILNYIEANNFQLISYCLVQFSRYVVRELWRYQWNAATIEKMDLADRTLCSFPTGILLGLREAKWPRRVPAAVRLQSLKGAAAPEKRDPGSIRAVLQAPNRMISFVHTSDEPADVLRELGVFLGRSERARFFEGLGEKVPIGVCEEKQAGTGARRGSRAPGRLRRFRCLHAHDPGCEQAAAQRTRQTPGPLCGDRGNRLVAVPRPDKAVRRDGVGRACCLHRRARPRSQGLPPRLEVR